MAAPPPPREALRQPTKLADPEPRAWIQRPPRPAPTPTPDDQDQAEQYARALKRARLCNYPKVTKEEVLEASLYKHAVKSRMLEDASAGAPQGTITLQAAVATLQASTTALQASATALQASTTALQASTTALQASTTALQALVTAGHDATTARYALEDARRLNKAANPSDHDAPFTCPLTAAGAPLPDGCPTTQRQLWDLSVERCDAMLAYYGLVQAAVPIDKRLLLARHLGFRLHGR